MEILSYLTYSTSVIWIQMIRRASFPFPHSFYLPTLERPSMQILTSWEMREGLGRVKVARLPTLSLRVSGADLPPLPRGRGLAGFYFGEPGAAGNLFFWNFGSPFSESIWALPWLIPFSCSAYLCLLPAAVGLWVLQQDTGWIHGLALFARPFFRFLRVSEIQSVPNGEFGAWQIKELAGPLWATGWPALSKHKKRILYQNFHADLWEQGDTGEGKKEKMKMFYPCLSHIHMYTNIHSHKLIGKKDRLSSPISASTNTCK